MGFFAPQDFLRPELSLSAQAFVRIAYGVLLLGTLLSALPHGRRFFLSERWGGYAQSAWGVDSIQNPVAYPLVMALWLGSAALMILGLWPVGAALVNLFLCRYFFVQMRWRGVLRGMGAPGWMSYWLGAAVFLLEYSLHYAPELRPLILLVLQVDFAFIMLSAGLYKLTAGYLRNNGMELGLVNPQWGYWWKSYSKLSPDHWTIKTMNQLAWATEVTAGILMLIPSTRFLGALLVIVGFAFVVTQIRLGLLCEMVMLCGVLFFHPGSLGDRSIASLLSASAFPAEVSSPVVAALNVFLEGGLWAYLILLPLAHGGLSWNLYARRSLPGPLQITLERYTNFFGMIIWRVFSADIVNFYVLIYKERRGRGGERTPITHYGWRQGGLRYSHVAESIALTSVFTTLKYYPSNFTLFRERLLRYARTVPCPPDSVLVFEYVSLFKGKDGFKHVPVAEYIVDPVSGALEERVLEPRVSVRAAHPHSPLVEGQRPGSYLPFGASSKGP